MAVEEIFKDASLNAKGRVKTLCERLLTGKLSINELLDYTDNVSASNKATCIESIECATRKMPEMVDETALNYLNGALSDSEPRVKWESARVIGNIAKLYPAQLGASIEKLLANTNHEGSVVRWASAFALVEILKVQGKSNVDLLQQIERLATTEKDEGVKKKYLEALKKVKK